MKRTRPESAEEAPLDKRSVVVKQIPRDPLIDTLYSTAIHWLSMMNNFSDNKTVMDLAKTKFGEYNNAWIDRHNTIYKCYPSDGGGIGCSICKAGLLHPIVIRK